MNKQTNYSYDYESDLDILHVYSSDIKEGIKGCVSIGDINIDVGYNDKIIGVEIEEASKLLKAHPLLIKIIGN